MPKKKVKKSKNIVVKQKQVVNVNIHNTKKRAKRVNKPKTNPRKLYPAEVQSHNSGVVLPYTHQFYLPPNDKSTPSYEELINTHRDGNLLQIKQSNVKLPKKVVKPQKIQDNNQAINNGVINEKSTSSLRSKSSTGTIRRRSAKS